MDDGSYAVYRPLSVAFQLTKPLASFTLASCLTPTCFSVRSLNLPLTLNSSSLVPQGRGKLQQELSVCHSCSPRVSRPIPFFCSHPSGLCRSHIWTCSTAPSGAQTERSQPLRLAALPNACVTYSGPSRQKRLDSKSLNFPRSFSHLKPRNITWHILYAHCSKKRGTFNP